MYATSINNPLCHLAECPIWNPSEQTLYWTDILERKIWKYVPTTGKIDIHFQGDMMVGGIAITKDSHLILCTEKGVYRLADNRLDMIFDISMADDERFNDITTDPMGRIFAGTLTDRRVEGILYRLEKDRDPFKVLTDVGTSNGMTFSLDLKHFYHTDSHARIINRYDYDCETGEIDNPHTFYHAHESDGVPDGITIDLDGNIWIACWRGSKVICVDPDGNKIREISTSAPQTSSLIFAGAQMNELYITSACQGTEDITTGLDKNGKFLGGIVYHVKLDVAGRGEWLADF